MWKLYTGLLVVAAGCTSLANVQRLRPDTPVEPCHEVQKRYGDCSLLCAQKADPTQATNAVLDSCGEKFSESIDRMLACYEAEAPEQAVAYRSCMQDSGCTNVRESRASCFGEGVPTGIAVQGDGRDYESCREVEVAYNACALSCAERIDPDGPTADLIKRCARELPPDTCYREGSPKAPQFMWCLKANGCMVRRTLRPECFVPTGE